MFLFFLRKIFLQRSLFLLIFLTLFVMLSYISFTTSRAVFSTIEGFQESSKINQPRMYITNLDPGNTPNVDTISESNIQEIYNYLDNHHDYAFYTDGYIVDLPNTHHMEVSVSYMNKLYDELKGFPLSEGKKISFDHNLQDQTPIPVYVGHGLRTDYPLGTIFNFFAPGLDKKVLVEVKGILSPDVSHSNYYALDSKQYYNFSIVFPVNNNIIREATVPLKLNGLMDLIVKDTDNQKMEKFASYIKQKIEVTYNFFNQQENEEFYREYFVSSMIFILTLTIFLILSISGIALWSSLSSIQVIIKEFTLNLLVGLSYKKLRHIFYTFYFIISTISIATIFALTEYSRWQAWAYKESSFATYGFAGLLRMDWLALLVATFITTILTVLIVELSMWKIKKIPISVGVLQ